LPTYIIQQIIELFLFLFLLIFCEGVLGVGMTFIRYLRARFWRWRERKCRIRYLRARIQLCRECKC